MNILVSCAWQCLLRAYPAEFRYEFGFEMTQAFEQRYHEEHGTSRLRLFLSAAADVLATATKERYYVITRDIRHSYRRLMAHPLISAVAVFSLALGIAANTTIFSIIYAAVLRPLPYPEVDRRIIVFTGRPNTPSRGGATTADFIDWRARSSTLEDWHMFSSRSPMVAIGEDLPEPVMLQHVTPGLLESLGVRPVIGRLFQHGEEGGNPLLISERYWRLRFGAKSDVLGKKLFVGDGVHTIIGVVPAGFELFDEPSGIDLWNTIDLAPGSKWVQRRIPWLMATAKLKPNVSLETAQSELSALAAGLAEAYPESNRLRGVRILPIAEARKGNAGSTLYPLFGAVAFVLLIACANVANLLLARAVARRRELSVRAAIGAGRARLIREFLCDGFVLTLPAVALGVALAWGGLLLFRSLAPPGFPGVATVELNAPVLYFTVVAGLVAGVLCTIFPAVEGSKADLTEALKEGARGSAGRRRQRLRSLLVAGEVALALVLLTGAGLMIGTVMRLEHHELGFNPANVTVAQLHLTGTRYMKDAPPRGIDMRVVLPAVPLFIEHVLREVRTLPRVETAALAGSVPMVMSGRSGVAVRTRTNTEPEARLGSMFTVVTAGFFETLRIPLRAGRYINEHDTGAAPWVAVVNEAFAREFFPNGTAIGELISTGAGTDERPRQIVGIVADHTQFTPKVPAQPEMYTSYLQQPTEIPGTLQGQRFRPKLVVRSHPSTSLESSAIRKIVAGFDQNLAVLDVKSLEVHLSLSRATPRFYTHALALFSMIAVVLAALGVYGLMNYAVLDRVHEIGIRLSLGASRRQIVWLIVRQGGKLALAGITVGVAGALMATRFLQGLLFGVAPRDPLTFSVVTTAILAIALAACAVPAFRATRVDPIIALRRE